MVSGRHAVVALVVATLFPVALPAVAEVGNGPGFDVPRFVAVEADDNLVVSDTGAAAIFRVDPNTGDRTILSDATLPTGTFTYGTVDTDSDGQDDLLQVALHRPTATATLELTSLNVALEPGKAYTVVLSIEFEGQKRYTDKSLRGALGQKVGAPRDDEVIDEGIGVLWRIFMVRVDGVSERVTEGGVELTVTVTSSTADSSPSASAVMKTW